MSISQYKIIRELSRKSTVVHDSAGRSVILKTLPSDCLLEGQLNPNIAERLRRVREIAMTDVANLRGVERDGDRIVLVWDFVEGAPLDAYSADPSRDLARLVRELVHTVGQFHSTGLVHGALHSGNVLVDATGRIKLIDVSPLLFLDPERDEAAVLEMCRKLVNLRQDPQLAAAVVEAGDADSPMRVLSARMSASAAQARPATPRVRIRRRTLFAALVMILIGVGLTIAIERHVHRNQPTLLTPPRAPGVGK
jgi:tRNA A-37 threonylcarbamoyl transferase component Bud32